MNVFISWSGNYAKELAKEINDWLPLIIQSTKLFFSPDDIQKGEYWASTIKDQLNKNTTGIICLTKENQTAPWINYEAGALSKSVSKTKIFPLLFDLDISELQGPLALFNATKFLKDDFYKLLVSINSDADNIIPANNLKKLYDKFWPELEERISGISQNKNSILEKTEPRSNSDVLEEVLKLQRETLRISAQEKNKSQKSIENLRNSIMKIENAIWKVPLLLKASDETTLGINKVLPKRIDCKIDRFSTQGNKWISAIGFINSKPIAFFSVDSDDFYLPPWVNDGIIINNIDRFDFQFQDKQGYKVTIEGFSNSRMTNGTYNYTKIISNMLFDNFDINQIIKVIESFDSKLITGFHEWKNGIIKSLSIFETKSIPEKNSIKSP